MTPERRTLVSLLDAVETLYTALEHSSLHLSGELAQETRERFEKHRRELHGDIVGWPHE